MTRLTVHDYAAYHSESALSQPELTLIVPLIRAYYVWLCSFSVFRWLDGHPKGARSRPHAGPAPPQPRRPHRRDRNRAEVRHGIGPSPTR